MNRSEHLPLAQVAEALGVTEQVGSRLHRFITGLEKARDTVVQGLSTRRNSGPVEDRAHRIGMIKRQRLGRTGPPCSADVSSSPRHKTAGVT
ncbi:hypothetical protein [Streptomyces globisporus]|uniref:hypothetical protein n=1 Tax=Streptomyces globisporus TaxID=1908 RepID=UPI0004CC332D|nr:hypothetical protein [Streptomyces globisporus]